MLDATSDAQTSLRSKLEYVRFVGQGEQIQDRQKHPIHSHISSLSTRITDTSTTTRCRGGQDNSNSPQQHVVTYNPMTVKHESRLHGICKHFRHAADIIFLQGTCLKDREDEGQARKHPVKKLLVRALGWSARSPASNISCSVMILLRKILPDDLQQFL